MTKINPVVRQGIEKMIGGLKFEDFTQLAHDSLAGMIPLYEGLAGTQLEVLQFSRKKLGEFLATALYHAHREGPNPDLYPLVEFKKSVGKMIDCQIDLAINVAQHSQERVCEFIWWVSGHLTFNTLPFEQAGITFEWYGDENLSFCSHQKFYHWEPDDQFIDRYE